MRRSDFPCAKGTQGYYKFAPDNTQFPVSSKPLVAAGNSDLAGLVGRQGDAGVGQYVAYRLDVGLAAGAAVVRMVQEGLDLVQRDLEAGAMRRLDVGTQMVEQGFDLAPVDVGRRRVLEDAAHQVGVLVTHDEAPSWLVTELKYLSLKIRARMTIMREINMLNKLRISLKVQVVNSLPMHQQSAVLKMQQTESRLANTPKLVLFRTDYLE